MKIAILSPFLFRYLRGVERFTVDLSNSMGRLGAEVHVLTWKWNEPWAWGELEPNVFLHPIRLPRYYQSLWAGFAYTYWLAKIQPDFVMINFLWHGEKLALRLLPNFIRKTFYVLHYPAEQVPHRYKQIRESNLIQKGLKLISISQYVADGVEEWLGDSYAVIPNGVNVERFSPTDDNVKQRESLGIPQDDFVLLTVAALEKRKGIHKVLSALPEVVSQVPNFLYLVVGTGSEHEKIQQQASELGLEANVRLPGNVSDPLPIYQVADIFVFLSRGEASPLAPLEAMACGLPMIAAQRRPLDEICAPLGTYFVDDTNTDQIVASILELYSDSQKRAFMGRESRNHVEEHYAWGQIAERYMHLFVEYQEVLL